MKRYSNKRQLDLIARLHSERVAKRQAQQAEAASRRIQVFGFVGRRLKGQDQDGKHIDLKIESLGWKWRVGFKRKNGDGWVDTDSYHAVRMFGHIKQTHQGELFDNDLLLAQIDPMHAALASGGRKTGSLLQEYIDAINSICIELARKENEHKQEGREKLSEATPLLEDAVVNPSKRPIRVGAASSKMPAFKTRYVEGREEEIFGIDGYEKPRGEFFRSVRHQSLLEMFYELAAKLQDNPIGMVNSMKSDRDIIFAMREGQNLLRAGNIDGALDQIVLCQDLAKVDWICKGVDRVRSTFEAMRKAGFNGWRAEARGMMEDYARFIGQGSPRYVYDELAETNDAYLKACLIHLQSANLWIQSALNQKSPSKYQKIRLQKKDARRAASEFRLAIVALVTSGS